MMLFKVDLDKSVKELNTSIDTIPEFQKISDRNLKYIFLVYDYDTPYKQLPIGQRKEKVALTVGFRLEKGRNIFDKNARDIMNGKNRPIERAIKAFKELIYDSDRETLQSIEDLINNIKDDIRNPGKNPKELKDKADLAQKLPVLSRTKKELAQILDVRDESPLDEEDGEEQNQHSTLEMINEGIL